MRRNGAGKTALTKLRISQSAVNTRSAVLWIAQGRGFFAKYGLDVETIYLRSSNLQMAAMATGEVQFGSSGGAPVLSAVSGGQDLKIVASPSNRLSYDVVVRPRSKKQKICAANASASPTSAAPRGWRRYSRSNIWAWMTPRSCSHQRHRQSDDSRPSDRGGKYRCHASRSLSEPQDETKGAAVLVELQRAKIPFVNTSLVVNGNYLRDHADSSKMS